MRLFRRRPASLSILGDADFRNYFIADMPFEFGAEVRRFSMSWMALTLTGSQFWVGLVTGLPGLTIALFGPFAGVAVDRYNRRNLLIGVRAAFVAFALPLGVLALTGEIEPWHLILATLLVGAVRALSLPALRAFLTDLVGRERLLSANALTGSSSSAGELAGPVVSGFVVKALGVASGFFMVAAAFGTCALMLFRVRPQAPTDVSREQALRQVREGLAYVTKTPPLPALMVITVTQLPAGVVTPLIPVYARDVLEVGAPGYGMLSGLLGAGFLVGALATSVVQDFPKKGLALIVTAICWDAGALAFGFSRAFPLSLAMMFVMGVAGAVHSIFLLTLFQTIASDQMQGRVLSLYTVVTASFPLGFILGGGLASLFGNEVAIVIGMAISTPVALVTYAMSPALRRV